MIWVTLVHVSSDFRPSVSGGTTMVSPAPIGWLPNARDPVAQAVLEQPLLALFGFAQLLAQQHGAFGICALGESAGAVDEMAQRVAAERDVLARETDLAVDTHSQPLRPRGQRTNLQ